jgi:Mn-dependent DtxR family transcriptional regulator
LSPEEEEEKWKEVLKRIYELPQSATASNLGLQMDLEAKELKEILKHLEDKGFIKMESTKFPIFFLTEIGMNKFEELWGRKK